MFLVRKETMEVFQLLIIQVQAQPQTQTLQIQTIEVQHQVERAAVVAAAQIQKQSREIWIYGGFYKRLWPYLNRKKLKWGAINENTNNNDNSYFKYQFILC